MKLSLFKTVLLGVFGLAALIGLFAFATYSSHGGTTGGIGTVVIWGTLPKADVDAALSAVMNTDTSIKGVSYVQKDPAALSSDLATAIATGASPDLVLASQEELHTLSKFLTPIPFSTLSARTFTNTFVEEGNLLALPNAGGYYGIPFLVDPLVLFSNNAILASDNIAKPPATWEALTGLVPNVAVQSPTQQITRGLIALGTYSNVHDARGILSALFEQVGVPISSYSPSGTLSANLGESTPGANGQPPGEAVLGFYTQFADPSKVSYSWNASLPDSEQAFQSGSLALYLGYVSEARFLAAANPNLSFDVTPLPQPATATTKSTYGLLYSFMIPRGSANESGAYQAAKLLSGLGGTTANDTVAASATGLAPASRSALAVAPNGATAAVAYASALYATGWLSPAPSDTDQVFSGMINDVISSRTTPATALSIAGRSLSSLLQQ